jgi:hypothetical protein
MVRASAAAVLAALCACTTAAAADAPAGFAESPGLEQVASWVAGKPVTILCSKDAGTWAEYVEGLGLLPAGEYADGLARPDLATLYLPASTCMFLTDRLAGYPWPEQTIATALLALLHESEHLAGVSDESAADCNALRLFPVIAIRWFHYASRPRAKHRQLHDLVYYAWQRHGNRPAQYRVLC